MAMVFSNGMKNRHIAIDHAGRVVLPKAIREELAIHPGDLLTVSVQGDRLTLRPNREKAGFIKQGKTLVFSTGGTDLLDNDTVENIRLGERDPLTAKIAKDFSSRKSR
jgi:AbrB family looped-hinge helix DNA binding protein